MSRENNTNPKKTYNANRLNGLRERVGREAWGDSYAQPTVMADWASAVKLEAGLDIALVERPTHVRDGQAIRFYALDEAPPQRTIHADGWRRHPRIALTGYLLAICLDAPERDCVWILL